MICLSNPEFKSVLDRNGVKIHITAHALINNYGHFIKCQVIGFSKNYKYVYLVCDEILYKRTPENIVIVNNLMKWKHSY
jgi:hypothetical protein